MTGPGPGTASEAETELGALAARDLAASPAMPGRLLHVLAPRLGLDVEVAAGDADVATREPLRPGARFRIASVTKTFVGAAALRLVEDGRLSLDASLDELLLPETRDVLRDGGYDTGAIVLRHLLTHTSGIYDFAASAYDPSIADGFDDAIARDPSHRWTRLEQVRFAVTHGHPYGRPGTVFGYSDTGACLVGETLEEWTGRTMGGAIRELVGFERLGLRHTWHETVEPEPSDLPQLSHQYEGEVDIGAIDPSVDLWGGGGLMSTCGDLARFFRALLRGEVFHDPATLGEMTTLLQGIPAAEEMAVGDDPSDAGMFIFRAEAGGETWWGHDGWWGTTVYTCPRLDLTVVAGHQQAKMPKGFKRRRILDDVLAIVARDLVPAPDPVAGVPRVVNDDPARQPGGSDG
ncbi:MAG: serine hydrolase domain-containing protein [Actinomycetota bacterium]